MNTLKILEPEIFSKYPIKAGISLKNDDIFPPYGFSVGQAEIYSNDELSSHIECLASHINTERNRIKFVRQTHSSDVFIVDKNFTIRDGDGMATNEKDLALCVKLADCAGILLYEPETQAIASIHSGWRGTVQNIAKNAVQKLIQEFGAKPENILAYVSPCAGKEKYEVQSDVAQYFDNFRTQVDETHYLIDIKGKIAEQLIQSGLRISNIEISPACTISSAEFHSFRRDKEKSGRMGAFIMME